MAKYLARDAAIKHFPQFESAIVKIPEGREHDLTIDERDAVEHLKKLMFLRTKMEMKLKMILQQAFLKRKSVQRNQRTVFIKMYDI